jgi:hypothetical protein
LSLGLTNIVDVPDISSGDVRRLRSERYKPWKIIGKDKAKNIKE